MDVLLWIIWWVVLYDPVNCRNIQPTSRHVCAQQDALVRLAEFKEGAGALGLLLLAVNVLHRDVNVVEQLTAAKKGAKQWQKVQGGGVGSHHKSNRRTHEAQGWAQGWAQ